MVIIPGDTVQLTDFGPDLIQHRGRHNVPCMQNLVAAAHQSGDAEINRTMRIRDNADPAGLSRCCHNRLPRRR